MLKAMFGGSMEVLTDSEGKYFVIKLTANWMEDEIDDNFNVSSSFQGGFWLIDAENTSEPF